MPLVSPTSGQPSLGVVVQPRYGWDGIGPVMGCTGWRVIPTLLRLPLLPRSARDIPPWVISTVVIMRLKKLLEQMQRRFEYTSRELPAPKGTVDWERYARVNIAAGRAHRVPCRFPDLRDDSNLLSAIHYTLRRQMQSLESQRSYSVVVLRLLELCHELLRYVTHVPPTRPSSLFYVRWSRVPIRTLVMTEALEAIEWTADERGLAGLTDLSGLPWSMSMDEFFESWLEVVVAAVARRLGYVVRTGRTNQTVAPISWDPPFRGSQRSLRPDVILESTERTIILDAKYKDHGEALSLRSWHMTDEELREHHRTDLLQVLAYANLSTTERTSAVLAYPCGADLWDSLVRRRAAHHRADIYSGARRISVFLVALPLSTERMERCVDMLAELLYG